MEATGLRGESGGCLNPFYIFSLKEDLGKMSSLEDSKVLNLQSLVAQGPGETHMYGPLNYHHFTHPFKGFMPLDTSL